MIERELQGENCLLYPGRGLHTLKPDAARLQGSEVHYGLNFEVWMAYLEQAHPSSSQSMFITPFQEGLTDQSRGAWVIWVHWTNGQCLCVHCVKSKLENSHLSARWRRFMTGSLKKSVVCVKPQWRPISLKQPPCLDRPLCGLFTLRAILDSTCTQRHAHNKHTAHLENMCVPQTVQTNLNLSVCRSVCLSLKQTHTHTHLH